MNQSMPGLPVHQQLPESTQTHVHWVSDAIQPSHPLLSYIKWKEQKAMTNLDIVLKSRHITLPTKVPIGKSMIFPVVMLELDHKGWVPKSWCFQAVVLEKTLESSLDSKEIKPVNPEGNQPWIFIGRTKAETPILWLPDAKNWLIGKDPDAGKDWRQEETGKIEDEMDG